MKQQQILQCKRLRLDDCNNKKENEDESRKPTKANFYFYLQHKDHLGTQLSRRQHQNNKYNEQVSHKEIPPYNLRNTTHHKLKNSANPNNKLHYNNNNNNNDSNNNRNVIPRRRWLTTETPLTTGDFINRNTTPTIGKGFLVLNTKTPLRTLHSQEKIENDKKTQQEKSSKQIEKTQTIKQTLSYEKEKLNLENDSNHSHQDKQDNQDIHNYRLDTSLVDDLKLMEEATVRNSIRKCEIWLKKYF